MIDVREPDEVIQGSIPSSVNIPLSVLPGALQMKKEEFEEKFGFAKPGRTQEIIFYCRSGVRAATAGEIARKNKYEKLVSHVLMSHDSLRFDRPPGCGITKDRGWNGSKKRDIRREHRRAVDPSPGWISWAHPVTLLSNVINIPTEGGLRISVIENLVAKKKEASAADTAVADYSPGV